MAAELLTILYCLKRRRCHKRRRFWVHRIHKRREIYGEFHHLVAEVLDDEEKCLDYIRIKPSTFYTLLELVGPHITKNETNFRKPIPAMERLVITLRYLAAGESHMSLSFHFRVGVSTVREITTETCAVLWDVLHPRVMPTPDRQKWINIANDFYARYDFPLCLGAIDGTHIRIKKPNKSGSLYYNYKGFFSIILLAVTDSEGKFVVVDVGSCGSNSDGGIFHKSVFGRKLATGTLDIPTEGTVLQTDIKLPFTFVSDDAFPLKDNIMKPFPHRQLTYEKEVFNNRLSRARNVVEGSFGRISMMWRILQRPMDVQANIAIDIVKAITVLHNFVLTHEPSRVSLCDSAGDPFQTPGTLKSWQSNISGRIRSTQNAMRVRDTLMKYFVSPAGTLPWQNDQCFTRPTSC